MAPLVAIVATQLPPGRITGWTRGGYIVRDTYVDALRRAGAQPVLVPALDNRAVVAELLSSVQGLLLMGGGDIDPDRYGAEAHPFISGVEPERDAVEIDLVLGARARGTPTLAICRGIQLVNVALGGTLHQHVPDLPGAIDHTDPEDGHAIVHDIRLAPGSRVAGACGTERVHGASRHHQAVDRVADGLVPTGWSADGLIEAVETDESEPWLVAVQWHPEETAADDPANQGLFDALTARAEEARTAGGSADAIARRPPRGARPTAPPRPTRRFPRP